MTKRNDAVLKKIAALGVTNPKKPTAQEIKVILDAYVRTKELDVKSFEIYRGLIDSSLRTIFDGFSSFSKDETTITATTLDIIRQALVALQAELDRKLSPKERREILNDLFSLVREAREESRESRSHKKGIGKRVVVVVGIVVAGIVWLFSGGGGGGRRS